MTPTRSRFALCVAALGVALVGCGGSSSDSIPECDSALEKVEAACSGEGLSDVAKKTCENTKKSIKSLAEIGMKSGKTQVAADGCQKQVPIIERITAKGGATAAKKVEDTKASPSDEDAEDGEGGEGGEGVGPQCEKLLAEVETACGSLSDPNSTQKMLCKSSQKVAETYRKLSVNNQEAAESACEKTLGDWSKKGGLPQQIEKLNR